MSISISGKRIYLYNKAVVNYQDIGLKADYIEFNMIDQYSLGQRDALIPPDAWQANRYFHREAKNSTPIQ